MAFKTTTHVLYVIRHPKQRATCSSDASSPDKSGTRCWSPYICWPYCRTAYTNSTSGGYNRGVGSTWRPSPCSTCCCSLSPRQSGRKEIVESLVEGHLRCSMSSGGDQGRRRLGASGLRASGRASSVLVAKFFGHVIINLGSSSQVGLLAGRCLRPLA